MISLMLRAPRVRVGDVALLPDGPCTAGTRLPASVQLWPTPAHATGIVRDVVPAYGTRFADQGPPPRGSSVSSV